MLLEVHMLQTHPPSNPNRDDLGAPKSAIFGGALRARISSQCIKRSIRQSEVFRERMQGSLGTRTVYFPELVANALRDSSIPAEDHEALVRACVNIASKEKDDKSREDEDAVDAGGANEPVEDAARPRTGQLIFVGPLEAREFVRVFEETRGNDRATYKEFMGAASDSGKKKEDSKVKGGKQKEKPEKESRGLKDMKKRLSGAYQKNAADIALFGRMVTSDAFENVEAAMQVAHAISTHRITPETDYYTAVDDLKGELDSGSAYLDEAQFSSATFYKYFSVNFDALCTNLGDNRELAARAVTAFIEAAATTVPSGKRNSYANNNLPDVIMVEIKDRNIPTSYANAFAKPVTGSEAGGMVGESVRLLRDYAAKISVAYAIEGQRLWCAVEDVARDNDLGSAGKLEQLTFPAMLGRIGNMLGSVPNGAGA